MGQIVNPDRDLEIFRAWSRGERQWQIGKRLGITQQSVSEAVARARRLQPRPARVEIFDQSTEILDDGLAVFVPMMLDGDKAAGRLVDRLLGRRNGMLGLESPVKLELHQAEHEPPEPVDVKAELAALVLRMRNGQHD